MANDDYNDRYTIKKGEEVENPAHPGKPLEPDELPENPPEFQRGTQGPRQEPDVHPTSELSSTPKHSASKRSTGAHPTSELHIKPRRR